MANNIMELSDDTFASVVASGTVLVDFWAPWCGPCRMQGPILEELAAELAGKGRVIAKLNIDDYRQVAEEFGIQSIPTLLVFKDGKLAQTLIGVQQKPELLSALA